MNYYPDNTEIEEIMDRGTAPLAWIDGVSRLSETIKFFGISEPTYYRLQAAGAFPIQPYRVRRILVFKNIDIMRAIGINHEAGQVLIDRFRLLQAKTKAEALDPTVSDGIRQLQEAIA